MRFAANLSTLCQDIPRLTDRLIHLAKRQDYSFKYIECQNPYGEDINTWKSLSREHDLSWCLINSPPLFDQWKDGKTCPTTDEYKKLVIEKAKEYAVQLSCPVIHLVMTDLPASSSQESNSLEMSSMLNLIDFASRELDPHGITCVLEPLSIRPNYYLRSYEVAKDIVCQLKRPNLKVMLDTFHLQKLHGNLTEFIDKTLSPELIGHVQVSQTPLRDCPLNEGEVNHGYILKKINKVYDGVIGLEYNSTSSESFSWLKDFHDL